MRNEEFEQKRRHGASYCVSASRIIVAIHAAILGLSQPRDIVSSTDAKILLLYSNCQNGSDSPGHLLSKAPAFKHVMDSQTLQQRLKEIQHEMLAIQHSETKYKLRGTHSPIDRAARAARAARGRTLLSIKVELASLLPPKV